MRGVGAFLKPGDCEILTLHCIRQTTKHQSSTLKIGDPGDWEEPRLRGWATVGQPIFRDHFAASESANHSRSVLHCNLYGINLYHASIMVYHSIACYFKECRQVSPCCCPVGNSRCLRGNRAEKQHTASRSGTSESNSGTHRIHESNSGTHKTHE